MTCSNPFCGAISSTLPCKCGAKSQAVLDRFKTELKLQQFRFALLLSLGLHQLKKSRYQRIQNEGRESAIRKRGPSTRPIQLSQLIDIGYETQVMRSLIAEDDAPICTNEVVEEGDKSVEIIHSEKSKKNFADVSLLDAQRMVILLSNLQILANLTNENFGQKVVELVKIAEDPEQDEQAESITKTKHNNFMSIKTPRHSPKLWNVKPNNHLRGMHQIKQPCQRRNFISSKSQRHSRSK